MEKRLIMEAFKGDKSVGKTTFIGRKPLGECDGSVWVACEDGVNYNILLKMSEFFDFDDVDMVVIKKEIIKTEMPEEYK